MTSIRWAMVGILSTAAFFAGCNKVPETAGTTPNGAPSNGAPPANTAAPDSSKDTPKEAATAPPVPRTTTVTLKSSLPIRVRTTTMLSTKSTEPGARFSATLSAPLVVDGKTIAPKGAMVRGVVVDSDPGGRVKGVASISVRLTSLAVHGKEVPIQTASIARHAPTSKTRDAEEVGIGAGIGAAIGALAGGGKGAAIGAASGGAAGTGVVLATRGKPAEIPPETPLTFKLTAPVTVEVPES